MTSREHFAQFGTLLRLVTSSPATVGPAQTFVVAFAKCFLVFSAFANVYEVNEVLAA
jgi:hypothetical protein